MKHTNRLKQTCLPLMILVLALFPFPAEAGYLDPNTGGMLFQILAGLFTLVSGFFFVFANKIKLMFAKAKRKRLEKQQLKSQASA